MKNLIKKIFPYFDRKQDVSNSYNIESDLINLFPPTLWNKHLEDQKLEIEEGEIDESDLFYTNEILDKTSKLLMAFKDKLKNIDGEEDPKSIKLEVLSVVGQLNELNEEFEFIETGEREDLCEWIEIVAKSTGYTIIDYEDLTEDYREW